MAIKKKMSRKKIQIKLPFFSLKAVLARGDGVVVEYVFADQSCVSHSSPKTRDGALLIWAICFPLYYLGSNCNQSLKPALLSPSPVSLPSP